MMSLPVVVAMVLALVASGRVHAAVFQCPAGDVACLIAAINTANGNGEDNTITLEAGTYTLTTVDNETDGPNGLPSITGPLAITGAGAEMTIIARDANAPPFRILHVAATGTLIVQGVTLAGGAAEPLVEFSDGIGGSLFDAGGGVELLHCRVTGNSAGAPPTDSLGGGIHNGGVMTITDSLIADNVAGADLDNGAGISNSVGGTLTLLRSIVRGNGLVQGSGGGIHNRGVMTVVDSTISDDSITDEQGGGIFNGGTLTVTNSTIADNRVAGTGASGGGGIANFGTVTVTNSTIAGNLCVGCEGGGVIFNVGGMVELQNTILARNQSGTVEEPGAGPDCAGPVTSLGTNLIGDPSDCDITLQPTDLTGDPGLGAFVDDNTPGHEHFPLLASSRAIDAGNDDACPPTDQLGQPRVGRCDIGAIEFQSQALTVTLDVKPGSSPNTINPKSNGGIPVAILTTETVDATTVDPLSVRFGPQGATEAHNKGHIEDVNHDGKPDLVLHFRTQDTGIKCGDTSASQTGETFDGDPIWGSDTLKTVGCTK
jgi:hypothetical protein